MELQRASTLRTSCLALCYSAVEYACPVWVRTTYANKLNPALHNCCRITIGCLKPANVTSIRLLAGIAPPDSRRTVLLQAAWNGNARRQKPATNFTTTYHLLADLNRGSFMRTETPLDSSRNYTRLHNFIMWNNQLTDPPATIQSR